MSDQTTYKPLKEFGEEAEGWDVEGTGRPGVALVANAIQFWSERQMAMERPNTIQAAADAFGMTEGLVRQAVLRHGWMLIGANDEIEHEGE